MTVNANINRLLIGSVLFLSFSLISADYVPVYIWESSLSNEVVPALPRINHGTLKEIVKEKLEKSSIVVLFAEPNLSTEDFRAVDGSGKTVYNHLASIETGKTYLPSAQDPIDVIKSLYVGDISQTTPNDFNVDDLKTTLLIIDLNDVQENESRNEMLYRHDKTVRDIYAALKEKYGSVTGVYTGYHTSWVSTGRTNLSRPIRNANTRANGNGKAWGTGHFLLYVSNTPGLNISGTWYDLSNHTAAHTFNEQRTNLEATLSSPAEPTVYLAFNFTGGYWILHSVAWSTDGISNQTVIRVRDINAPEGFSFQCTSQTFKPRGTVTAYLALPGMQLQVFRTNYTTARFGDPYYCVGFTTAPIWSGIFVTGILVAIMAVGLSMMMDIKTMDRFDDPKGKTIQINASE